LFYYQLDWAQYLREVFHGVNVTFDTDSDLIIVMDGKYFQKLSFLLQKTSPETIGKIFSSPKILELHEKFQIGICGGEFSRRLRP